MIKNLLPSKFLFSKKCYVAIRLSEGIVINSDDFKEKLNPILIKLQNQIGLRFIEFKCSKFPSTKCILSFLNNLSTNIPEPKIILREKLNENIVSDSGVLWKRMRWKIFPKFLEGIRFVNLETNVLPDGYFLFRGVLTINCPAIKNINSSKTINQIINHLDEGGCAINIVKVASESKNIKVKLYPTYSFTQSGASVAKMIPLLQSHIAASYWQTYWATSEIREIKDFTIPVAFFPRQRRIKSGKDKLIFKKISHNHFLLGSDTINFYYLRKLTSQHLLEFNLKTRKFIIRNDYVSKEKLKIFGLKEKNIIKLQNLLNDFGFIDQFLGRNIRFAPEKWKNINDNKARIKIQKIIPYSGATLISFFNKSCEENKILAKYENIPSYILAAVNSIFFISFPEEFVNIHSAIHDPISLIISEGKIIQPPLIRRGTFYIHSSGKKSISYSDMNSIIISIHNFPFSFISNKYYTNQKKFLPFILNPQRFPRDYPACIYTISYLGFKPHNFNTTPKNEKRIDFVIVNNQIVEVKFSGKTHIPTNGYILSLSKSLGLKLFSILKKGEIFIEYKIFSDNGKPFDKNNRVINAFSVGPVILKDYSVIKQDYFPRTQNELNNSPEEFKSFEAETELYKGTKGISPTRFPHNITNTRAPRTALGLDNDNNVYLIVVDGRANFSHSIGVSLFELSLIMKQLGCKDVLNLDGGGSSMMFVRSKKMEDVKILPDLNEGIVNFPSDRHTRERIIPFPLIVYKK